MHYPQARPVSIVVLGLSALAPVTFGSTAPAGPSAKAKVQLGPVNETGSLSICGCHGPLLDGQLLNQHWLVGGSKDVAMIRLQMAAME